MPTNDIEVRTFLIFLFQPKRIDCFSIVFCGIDKWLHANHLPSMDSAMHCSSFTLVAFNLTGPNLYLKNKQPRKVDISNIWWTPLDKNNQVRCLMPLFGQAMVKKKSEIKFSSRRYDGCLPLPWSCHSPGSGDALLVLTGFVDLQL